MDPKIDLKTVLELHAKWRVGAPGGSRADLGGADLGGADLSGAYLSRAYLSRAYLSGADLGGADLGGADLSGANLTGADLSRAYLSGADLSGADLSRTYLSGAYLSRAYLSRAYLSRAYLSGADLSRADLSGAYLSRADLSGADLSGADLSRADLSGANLTNCTGAELALAMLTHLPDGQFDAWKKCRNGVLVKLRIPAEARRSHGTERKGRCEYAKVLDVYGPDGIAKKGLVGISIHDGKTEYRKNQIVRPDGWDEDRWNTCGKGIHFYLTRLEAEAHQ